MALTIITFFIVFSFLIFAHELGHFYAARKFGAKVEEFGFGLPPRIFGFSKTAGRWRWLGGKKTPGPEAPTVYSLNWIPVGGFVKIKGENGDEEKTPDSFVVKPIWQRAIILAAGVSMNVILCVVLLAIGFGWGLPVALGEKTPGKIISGPNVQIIEVLPDLPAQKAGLRVGDFLLAVDGQTISSVNDWQSYLAGKEGQTVNLKIKSRGRELIKPVTVVKYQNTIGLGVGLVETAIVRYPWYLALWQALKATGIWLVTIIVAFAVIIKNLILGAPVGVEVAGPVGIAVLTGQMAKMGVIYVLQFTALLSLNLAIINFLPVPALDGGRLLFLLIEKIRGKSIKAKWENLVNNIGFVLLMALMLFFTVKDLNHYGQGIWSALTRMF